MPTRVTEKSSSLIDLVYVSNPAKIRATKVSKIAMSDHYPTSVSHFWFWSKTLSHDDKV